MAIDIFTAREMTRPFVQDFKPKTALAQRFIKRREVHETRTFQVDKVTGGRIMAVFSSPVSKGVPMRARGFQTTDITPGYIKLTGAITPDDCQNRIPGESIFASPGEKKPSLLSRAERKMLERLADMHDAIDRRVEYMTLTAVTTGKVQIVHMNDKGEVVTEREIDFGMPEDHVVTPEIEWDADGATILKNLTDWGNLCAKDGGMMPNTLIVDSSVALAIMRNADIKDYLDMRWANVAELRIELAKANGMGHVGVLRVPGIGPLEVLVYNEWYTDPADNTLKSLWPSDTVWLGNDNGRTELHCRPIEDFDIATEFPEANGSNMLAIPYFAKSWREKNPSTIQFLLQAGPIVVPFDIKSYVTARVLNVPVPEE
jgi:hypothetical protein